MGIGRVTAISAGVAGALYPWNCSQHQGPEAYYLEGATGQAAAVPEARWLGSGLADLGYAEGGQITKSDYVLLFGHLADPAKYAEVMAAGEDAMRERVRVRLAEEPDADKVRRREIRAEEKERLHAGALDEARLGRRVSQFRPYEERLAERLAQEPGAEPERVAQIQLELRMDTPKGVGFFDVTLSAQKSVSVYHASLLAAGRVEDAEKVLAAHRAGVEAALAHIEEKAGFTRAGYHGRSVEGRPTVGKYIDAHNLVAAEFLHHTSRAGDPQIHSHLTILNRVRTVDEKTGAVIWRTLDSRALHKERAAFSAAYERGMERKLVADLPVELAMRPDGKGREIVGILQAELDGFSTRTGQVQAEIDKMVAAYKELHGPDAEPSKYLLEKMRNESALRSRDAKGPALPMVEQVAQWERTALEKIKTDLAQIAGRADRAGMAARVERLVRGEKMDPEKVICAALDAVQADRASWTRADLVQYLNRALPDAEAVRNGPELLEHLAHEALSGRYSVIQVEGHRLIEPPESLRRASDGRDLYEPHDTARYALDQHISREEYLLTRAQTKGGPALHSAVVEQIIAERGLSSDQADVARGILTQGRQMIPVVGPAGTGKSYTLGVVADAWKEHVKAPVTGLAIGTVASEVLKDMGVDTTANVTKWLDVQERIAEGRASLAERMRFGIVPNQLIILDEASTADTPQFDEVARVAQRAGAIVVPVGDPAQRGAVGAGGAFRLLAREAQPLELETVRRFRADWEKEASLRLRAGDEKVLLEYDKRGRWVSGTREEMYEAAARGYVATTLAGKQAAIMTNTNEEAAAVSAMVRQQLVELGRVEEAGVPVSHGNLAGPGDLIQARENVQTYDSDGVQVNNRRLYQVIRHNQDGSVTALRVVNRDENGLLLGGEVRLDAEYLRESVDLAYAGTVDAVQGQTVYAGYGLITKDTTRSALYPELTRGTDENIGLIIIEEPEHQHGRSEAHPEAQALPEAQLEARPEEAQFLAQAQTEAQAQERPHHLTVLAQVLRNDDAERSAVETLRSDLEYIGSMPALQPRWAGTLADQRAPQYAAHLAQVLSPGHLGKVLEDPSNLYALLRGAEQRGHDPQQLLTEAVGNAPRSLADARDPAALVYWRVGEELKTRTPEREVDLSSYVARTPELDTPEGRYLLEVAEKMDARRDALGQRLAEQPAAWAIEHLGPVPTEPLERLEWERRAGTVEAYRELYGVDDDKLVIGRAPKVGAAEQRGDWEAAHTALGRPEETRAVERATDEQLRAMVAAYEREQAWAPAHVDEPMQETYTALRHQEERVQLERAALAQLADEQARTQAQIDIAAREAAIETLARQAADLELINEARVAWHDTTVETREAAQAALAELDRRREADQMDKLVRDREQAARPEIPEAQVQLVAQAQEQAQPEAQLEAQVQEQGVQEAVVEPSAEQSEARPVVVRTEEVHRTAPEAQGGGAAELEQAQTEAKAAPVKAPTTKAVTLLDMAQEVARARQALAEVAERTSASKGEEAERSEQARVMRERQLQERGEAEHELG